MTPKQKNRFNEFTRMIINSMNAIVQESSEIPEKELSDAMEKICSFIVASHFSACCVDMDYRKFDNEKYDDFCLHTKKLIFDTLQITKAKGLINDVRH